MKHYDSNNRYELIVQLFLTGISEKEDTSTVLKATIDLLAPVLKELIQLFPLGRISSIEPELMDFDPEGYHGFNWNIHIESDSDINGDQVYERLKDLNLSLKVAVFKTAQIQNSYRISDHVPGDSNPDAIEEREFHTTVRQRFPKARFTILRVDRRWCAEAGEQTIAYAPDENVWYIEKPSGKGMGTTLDQAIKASE